MNHARTAFVGLGEGIGNVLMGLPLIDALRAAGWTVAPDLRTTPRSVAPQLWDLIACGRPDLVLPGDEVPDPFDAAVLTHWWARQGGPRPLARRTLVGPAPTEDVPEILSNLEAAAPILPVADRTPDFGRVHVEVPRLDDWESVPSARFVPGRVVIHPGCKPDPSWRARKMYPHWPETVWRLKCERLRPCIVGSQDDADLFIGEPDMDWRECGLSLVETARALQSAELVLSGDSGIHHLALAVGRPTVAIFGQSSPTKAMHVNPRGPRPVILGPTDDLRSIAPTDVVSACLRAMSRTIGAST